MLAAFARWAAEERVGVAAQARRKERWLRQQAAETATLAGLLVDLAERRAQVTLTVGTRRVSGRLAGVGRDACAASEASGGAAIVALDHLVAVHVASPGGRGAGSEPPSGRRPPQGPWGLVDALAALAAERSRVRLALASGELLTGDLLGAGEDVVTLRPSDTRLLVHVAIAAIQSCTAV